MLQELVELFDKLDEHRNGHIKLETFIAGVQSQQKYTANITSTPPPPAVGWTSKPIHMVNSNCCNNPYVFY